MSLYVYPKLVSISVVENQDVLNVAQTLRDFL